MVGLRGDEEVPGQPGLHRDLTAGKDARTMEKPPSSWKSLRNLALVNTWRRYLSLSL